MVASVAQLAPKYSRPPANTMTPPTALIVHHPGSSAPQWLRRLASTPNRRILPVLDRIDTHENATDARRAAISVAFPTTESLESVGAATNDTQMRPEPELGGSTEIIKAVYRAFHMSSSRNRESIRRFGLDWTRMGEASGIAGSSRPEVQGCFLMAEEEIDWFLTINNTGGTVDLWRVDGVDEGRMVESPNGYWYLPERVPPSQLTLEMFDLPSRRAF
jgi:hypothetical protein